MAGVSDVDDGVVEYWDVLNSLGLPTGRLVARDTGDGDPAKRLRSGEYHRVVVVCVFGTTNRMLIQQRTANKLGYPNLWDLTAGGSAIAGETSQAAAARELAEEVGINIDLTGRPPHVSVARPDVFVDYYLVDGPDLDPASLVLQVEEVQAVRWATEAEILTLIAEGRFWPYPPSLINLFFDRHSDPVTT